MACHSECGDGPCLYVEDPIYPPKRAAAYLGLSVRSLRDLKLHRSPMPTVGSGARAWGYRRSTLNRCLARIEAERSRLHEPIDGDRVGGEGFLPSTRHPTALAS